MKINKKNTWLAWVFCCCWMCIGPVHAERVDSLLSLLDATLAERELYEQKKIQRIDLIKEDLGKPGLADSEIYRLNNRLYAEYESYISDSALFYINRNVELAVGLKNDHWLAQSMLKKAHALITSGLFVEAMELLEAIPKQQLGDDLADYYVAYENIYLYLAEYTMADYKEAYMQRAIQYRDSIVSLVPEDSYRYVITRAPMLMDRSNTDEAAFLLEDYLPHLSPDSHEFAVASSILAFVYHLKGQKDNEIQMRIRSAMADIKSVVKESYSLSALAELLFAEGQLERANHYIKISMEDTNRYAARLRSLQASKMLPIIDRAYQEEREAHQRQQNIFTGAVSLLAFFLLLAIIYVKRQMKKLAASRRDLVDANLKLRALNEELDTLNHTLTEANSVKEEYLGRFLQLCSAYIDKLEEYRRSLARQANAGKLNELYATLKSTQIIDEELKEFYGHFDSSFLKIFPRFIEEFNRLLPEEERMYPKNNELLTTELRVFALIRLGISDSNRIAGFLHNSVSTIYTYRSRLKRKAICKDTFEEDVMNINSF